MLWFLGTRSAKRGVGRRASAVTRTSVTLRNFRKFRIGLILAPLLLCSVQQQRDAEKDTTAILQANYLYNIAKLVEWKDADMREGNFIIGLIGGANLYQELIKQYATRTIGR